WGTQIRGVENGGAVVNLPVHNFPTDDGTVAMKCPTEVAIDDRREAELAKLGLMPILHRKNTDIAAFIGAHSLQDDETRAGR
ncbi:type VI secretion system contractile sheath large subunit, partial [Pseudomonas sp. BGM005]|nr:type VI secretion system contractile sheath large subunit [Pseudomonas sp. BG5]